MKEKVDKGFLLFWWHYYGHYIYSLDESEKFERIIDEYGVEKVLQEAVASYITADGSPTPILAGIRRDKVKELFECLPDIDSFDEGKKEAYEHIQDEFIQAVLRDMEK